MSDVWSRIAKRPTGECWLWQGYTTNTGYGYFSIKHRDYLAHRIVWCLTHPGSIALNAPKDKSLKQFVLHRCDVRRCCNPAHMFLGNYADNNLDAARKGRSRGPKGLIRGPMPEEQRAKISATKLKAHREARPLAISAS